VAMTFFENGGQWYVQTEKGIWKVNEGQGSRFALVVEPFHKFKEAHGGGTKKSTKN
jgi:hypothetical protein